MSPFQLEPHGADLGLRLAGGVTIEHARELHAALVVALTPDSALLLDVGEVARIDAAVLQVLIAAARSARRVEIIAVSDGWTLALARFGFDASVFTESRIS